MRRRLTESTIVILGILIGILTNVATGALPDMLPADWKPYLWLSWAPLGVIILLVVILEWRASRTEPALASGPVSQSSGEQRNIDTGGGAYAEGNIDKRQDGPFVEGNVYGPVIGQQIVQQALSLAPALHQLRAPIGDFVGREREIETLVQALGRAAHGGAAAAISGVRGMGGIGKTELAYALAQRLQGVFPEQILVELRGASDNPASASQALQAAIHAFERELKLSDDLGELRNTYCSVLAGKKALILADDAGDAAQVRPLLPPQGCALLVTSRNHFELPGMETFDLRTLPKNEAEELVLTICPRISTDAVTLAQLCGYLPLALRVSASLLESRPSRHVGEYLKQLSDERTTLAHLRDPRDRELDVEASLLLSYTALEQAAQMALRQLSVFPASFDQEAARAVVEVPPTSQADMVLEELCLLSLLEYDEGLERYSLHDLVRVFAAARLEDADVVRLRHARHYAQVAWHVHELYKQGGDALLAGLALFDQERTHIDAGWEWVRKYTPSPECDKVIRDYSYLTAYIAELRYHPRRERIPQLEAALSAARRAEDRDAEGAWLGNLGNAYADLGDARQAISFYEQHLVIAREIGDRRSEGNALGSLGLAYAALGDARQAISFYEQHLVIAREIGDRRGEGNTLGNLGSVYYTLGDARKAITFYEQQLAIAHEIGDRRGEGNTLGNLGIAYYALGDARQAISFYEQRLVIAREIGDRRGEGNTLGNLGIAYKNLGDARQAISFYEQQLVIVREIGDRQGEAIASWNLGDELAKQGNLARAVGLMQICVDFEREIGHPDAEADAARLEQVRQRIASG